MEIEVNRLNTKVKQYIFPIFILIHEWNAEISLTVSVDFVCSLFSNVDICLIKRMLHKP